MTQVAFDAGSAQWEARSHSWLAAYVSLFPFPFTNSSILTLRIRKDFKEFWHQRCQSLQTAVGCIRARHYNATAKTLVLHELYFLTSHTNTCTLHDAVGSSKILLVPPLVPTWFPLVPRWFPVGSPLESCHVVAVLCVNRLRSRVISSCAAA